MATKQKGPAVSLAGVESGLLPESPELRRERPEPVDDGLTIGGKPIPAELRHAIPYENTDQGIAERLNREHARAQVVTDPLQKALAQRRDDVLERGMDSLEARDAYQEVARMHAAPGRRQRFLSPAVIERRGMRGFEPVVDGRGEPVRVGNLVLAAMPEDVAQKRDEHFRARGAAALKQVNDEFREQRESLRSASSDSGSFRDDHDSLHITRGNQTENVLR